MWLGILWKHSSAIFWNNQRMPYLGTRGAVEVTHLMSFLGNSNQQMPNVGTTDNVIPFQADTPAVWTFFSTFILQDIVHRAWQVTLFPWEVCPTSGNCDGFTLHNLILNITLHTCGTSGSVSVFVSHSSPWFIIWDPPKNSVAVTVP